jgi:F-box protein, helicase, 18
VETAHSLAFKNIVFQNDYKVKSQGYRTNEIAELLQLKGTGEKHTEYILANHINKFITYFCNSDRQKVTDLNYLDVVSDSKAKAFVSANYRIIEKQTRLLLSKMDTGEIEITHDFYLKKFQLSTPIVNFDYILFDEGQDASPAMLDIFSRQNAVKVIVGDTYQQIYGWRHAVNSLERADYKTFNLSTSFRFGQDIADLAMEILKMKNHLFEYNPVPINGKGMGKERKTKAILARTNLGLLLKAIEYVTENRKGKPIYFEGNIHSYTYADDGTSLYDVLNLYNGNYRLIRDKLIKVMRDLYELQDYVEKTEDLQLGMMIEIVKEYGNRIPDIIKAIKEKHIDGDNKEEAEMIFSTVHRCKGMEYDTVQLVNDFITNDKLEKLRENPKKEERNTARLNEEINLLYVAVTRARSRIHIPETLLPKDFAASPHIHVMKVLPEVTKTGVETPVSRTDPRGKSHKKVPVKEKTFSYETVREKHKDAYKPWTGELDDELTVMYCEGVNVRDMAKHFGRTRGAIRARIIKLELEELYG